MTRPDAAADGSGDPTPDPTPDAAVLTDVLVLAAAAVAAVAQRARADADRLAGAPGETPEGRTALTAEADAAAGSGARLRAELAERGTDPDDPSLIPALRDWAAARPARDAAEALVGARLARGLVADLAAGLAGEAARAHLTGVDDDLAGPAARLVADVLADRRAHDRLALLARRMLGEALVLVETLLAAPPTALPSAGPALEGSGGGRRALVKRVKSAHGRRVGALGL